MDIRTLVHRGMVYGLTSAVIFVVIAAGVGVAVSLATDSSDGDVPVLLVALLMTVGVALFFPLRRGARRLVDSLVYGEVTPYDTFVEAVQDDMLESSPTGDVLQRIVDRIGDVLGLESTVMFVEKEPLGQRVVVSSGTRADEVVRDIYPRLESKIRFGDTDDIVDLRWRADSLLAVNLRSYGSRIGMLLLGPKIGGEVFVDDEKQLVSGIAPRFARGRPEHALRGAARLVPAARNRPGGRAPSAGHRPARRTVAKGVPAHQTRRGAR